MARQLNIKSDEAHDLAEKLARATGDTITQEVTRALRSRLREVERSRGFPGESDRQREEAFYRLIEGSRMRWKGAIASLDYDDILYDEYGLPR